MKKKLKSIVLCLIILLCTHINAQSKKKLDREAIKEMCGCFEIEFKYSETFSPKGDYVESKDYKTKALEWATLILDEKNELSIQHLLIINDSMVIKHWRQDWEYESEKTLDFVANNTWNINNISKKEVKGQWAQKVYQVDDSPRYSGSASWVHIDGNRYWKNTTDAPLPRREYSKRSDYNVTVRGNNIQITKNGWLHEQDNLKVIRKDRSEDKILAEEKGYNTYTKKSNIKCTAAIKWWEENQTKWSKVRNEWARIYSTHDKLNFKQKVDGKRLYQYLFGLEVSSSNKEIRDIINKFLN